MDSRPNNRYYQAPLQVDGYVNPRIAPVQPLDLYRMFNVTPKTTNTKVKNPYEKLVDGEDLFKGKIRDIAPLHTNLKTLEPLEDTEGVLHSQDGFGKYGYSSILNRGDNEDRYSSNFRRDNPNKFYSGINPFKLAYRGGYWGLGFLEKTLEGAVVKTGQGFGALYGLLQEGVKQVATNDYSFSEWVAGATDNWLSSAFDGWDKALQERYHYFQEKHDRDKKGFVASLTDGDFWMNDISDGISFLLSAMLEVGAIGKATQLGTKAATRLATLAPGVSTEAIGGSALKGVKATLGRVANKAAALTGADMSGAALTKSAVDVISQTLATTAIESLVEASDVKQSVYDSFEGMIDPETGMRYSHEDKNRMAAYAASEVFKHNMTILLGPQFLQTLVLRNIMKGVGKMFNKAEEGAGQASGRVKIGNRLGAADNVTYKEAHILKRLGKVGFQAAIGFISEGLFEENIQHAITEEALANFGAGEFYRPDVSAEGAEKIAKENSLFGNVSDRYMEQTKQFYKGIFDDRYVDDALSKSIGIGGLLGIGGGVVHSTVQMRQQAKVDRYWTNVLNKTNVSFFQANNYFKTEEREVADPNDPTKKVKKQVPVIDPKTGMPLIDEEKVRAVINLQENLNGLADIINGTSDLTSEENRREEVQQLNRLAKTVLFSQLAMQYIKAGKKDELLKRLNDVDNLSGGELQALGYEPTYMDESEKKEIVERLQNIAERLDKSYQWIENNVIDNVYEEGEAWGGLVSSKEQRRKRKELFEKKKAYLQGLAMQNAVLDSYMDDVNNTERNLSENGDVISSVVLPDGTVVYDKKVPITDITRRFNSRVPAIKNKLEVLRKEAAYHFDQIKTRESPGTKNKSTLQNKINGKELLYNQAKFQEVLVKIDELEKEMDALEKERENFLKMHEGDKNFAFEIDEDGVIQVKPKEKENTPGIEDLNQERRRRLNDIKREEINIQKAWIAEEWQQVAALKEEKVNQGRTDTRLSRRMTGSKNAYNKYHEREVESRKNVLGETKMKLYHTDPAKRVTAKKYVANEERILKVRRIAGKVAEIVADVNGKDLVAQLTALLKKTLSAEEFSAKLKSITDKFNGKPITVEEDKKDILKNKFAEMEDELGFFSTLLEYSPDDARFNDKYYTTDARGNRIIRPEYDDFFENIQIEQGLRQQIEDAKKVIDYLNKIKNKEESAWEKENYVRKKIADVYTETSDNIIDTYNSVSNNGTSEVAGDSFSTKQDLDKINEEIDELGQLKVIFEDRNKNDQILSAPEFENFIEEIDERIEKLKKIAEFVKERLNSRLRENQDFLVDTINNYTEQLGLDSEGNIINQPLYNLIESAVSPEILFKLKNSLTALKDLLSQENPDKKALEDTYWNISGEVAAIHEALKETGAASVQSEVTKQQDEILGKIKASSLISSLKEEDRSGVLDNLKDSVLGALQTLFYTRGVFTMVGIEEDPDNAFIDDNPSSPVYRFREHYNLRKLVKELQADESRTTENSKVSKEDLAVFLELAKKMQDLEDLKNSLASEINMLSQIETEKEVVEKKQSEEENTYADAIVPSVQQTFFLRGVASFLRRKTIEAGTNIGFRNWAFLQAPGGSGKTQSLGTWFNIISGISLDSVLVTAYTKEAARGMQKALKIEEETVDVLQIIDSIKKLTESKNFSKDVLIIDEYPAMDVDLQKQLFEVVQEYTREKLAAGKGEFKVIALGDTNQLTFNSDGSVAPSSGALINPDFFRDENQEEGPNDNHIGKMNIFPSLTVNFRSNLFPIVSFTDKFRGSSKNNVNEGFAVSSTDISLETKDAKGVVSVSLSEFRDKMISYLKLNKDSTRTRTVIVNENKVAEYKKLLTDNGIPVVEDPNDELTKGGVYVSTVKNVQGFSFDEVFIDLDNKDKVLFANTVSPNMLYNKAMYVATSRARSLVVVTNFPNLRNTQDAGIADLESKSLDELQTKDADFKRNREAEIAGAKDILGDRYEPTRDARKTEERETENKEEEKEEEKTSLDPVPEEKEEESAEVPDGTVDESGTHEDVNEEEEAAEEEPAQEEPKEEKQEEEEKPEPAPVKEQPEPEYEEPEDVAETTEEDESTIEGEETASTKTPEESKKELEEKVFDFIGGVFYRVKDFIFNLVFPTSHTVNYQMDDNVFKARVDEGSSYKYRGLRAEDKVFLVPFKQSPGAKSRRNFGYAIVTPALDSSGEVVKDTFRTVGVLSDKEIDAFEKSSAKGKVLGKIKEAELKNKRGVKLDHADVSNKNGFKISFPIESASLADGKVTYASSVKYFYNKNNFRSFNKTAFEGNNSDVPGIINQFIDSFYHQRIAQDPSLRKKLVDFYKSPENAKVVVFTKKELSSRKKYLPENYTVRPGRPYIMFTAYDSKSAAQFIPLSRKFLNVKTHNDVMEPVVEFIKAGKVIRKMLEGKGIDGKIGYSGTTAKILSMVASAYAQNPTPDSNVFEIKIKQGNYKFSLAEAEKVYNFYSLFATPAVSTGSAVSGDDIKNLIKLNKKGKNVSRVRTLTLSDGTQIKGTVDSYDPATKTFVIRDAETGELTSPLSGTISYSGKSYMGPAQKALNDIFNANGHLSKLFTSVTGNAGFVTDRDREGASEKGGEGSYKGYKFMGLLGKKVSAVAKEYDKDGNPKTYYKDVIDILEDLFTFATNGELAGKEMQYVDSETGTIKKQQLKFRVPVSVTKKDEGGKIIYDYSVSASNTSRTSPEINEEYFETNFDSMSPTQVYVEFDSVAEKETKIEVEKPRKDNSSEDTKTLIERVSKLPFSQRISELKKAGIITDVYRYGQRPIVVVDIMGSKVPFYRSSMGTSKKTSGKWYPFFGFGKSKDTDTELQWLIKASTEDNENNLNSASIAEYSNLINSTLNWDHSLDLTLQNPFLNPEITFKGNEEEFNERIFGEKDRGIVNDGGGSMRKAFQLINDIDTEYEKISKPKELPGVEDVELSDVKDEVNKTTSIEVAWTEQQLKTLPFTEIRDKLSEKQKKALEASIKEEGWESLDQFWSDFEDVQDDEEVMLRNELVNCLL